MYVFHVGLLICLIGVIREYKNLFRDINEVIFRKEDIEILYLDKIKKNYIIVNEVSFDILIILTDLNEFTIIRIFYCNLAPNHIIRVYF